MQNPIFQPETKGTPSGKHIQKHYDLRKEEVSLPCAALRAPALRHNIRWMQHFADTFGVLLAPHAKTTMAPELMRQQLKAGAWGVTVANIQQAWVAAEQGARQIILANQIIGKANFELAHALLKAHACDLYVCVDSVSNAHALNEFFIANGKHLSVLVEIGVPNQRCGVRNPEQLDVLLQALKQCDALRVMGIEFYEGVIHNENEEQEIRQFLQQVVAVAVDLDQQSLFATANPIVTGAGSAFYDLVTEALMGLPSHMKPIIRPGCYVTHDRGIYEVAQNKVMQRIARSKQLTPPIKDNLESALELWAYVQSRPEPNRAIVALGKRDAAFDSGLPQLERVYRAGQALTIDATAIRTTDLMDQHLFLAIPEDCPLQVGDIVVFSTSHPCITFDKWRYIALCEEEGIVDRWIATAF